MQVKVKETKNNKDSCTLGENVQNGNRVRVVKVQRVKYFVFVLIKQCLKVSSGTLLLLRNKGQQRKR